jgi:hypothetical protein
VDSNADAAAAPFNLVRIALLLPLLPRDEILIRLELPELYPSYKSSPCNLQPCSVLELSIELTPLLAIKLGFNDPKAMAAFEVHENERITG